MEPNLILNPRVTYQKLRILNIDSSIRFCYFLLLTTYLLLFVNQIYLQILELQTKLAFKHQF